MQMFQVEMQWKDWWIVVERGFASRDDAHWAIAQWRQGNECQLCPFRVTPMDSETKA